MLLEVSPATHFAASRGSPAPGDGLAPQFDYNLPNSAIAQQPVEPRSAARLLVDLDGAGATGPQHRTVADLPDLLERGDVLVVNETKVLPARLQLTKRTGGAAEVFLLEQTDPADLTRWTALVKPGRRLPAGTTLYDGETPVVVVETGPGGSERTVRLLDEPERHGTVPLPPYIHEPLADPDRYQTVYARTPGSVAAPTAGLHLTDDVLDALRAKGVDVRTVDLKVGLGTFRPLQSESLDDHVMHEERYDVPQATLDACREATGRVVAVGTTSMRALESAALTGELTGRTDLFIRPGFAFRVVDVLLTNFHQPRSTLLVLLSAFAGDDRWRRLYD